MEPKPDTEIEENAEFNPLTHNAKSSVEIKQTTRGPTFKIKVVSGENDLIAGMTETVVKAYNDIQNDLNIKGGK